MAENLFLELVPDPTDDEPEACRILVTDLHNLATPLIRYDIADRVVPAPPCVCGRGLPGFRRVFGRAYDFVETPDGTRYHGEFFMYMLEEARDAGAPIWQAQFVQEKPAELVVRIVAGPGYQAAHGAALARRIAEKTEGRLSASIEPVDALVRERSGKLRLIKALEAGGGHDGSPSSRVGLSSEASGGTRTDTP
jgi:phenylacetate-CoA ligase